MKHYDLCVIGAGPAGFAAAMRGLDLGKRVLLIEKDQIGGAGLHNGALSSKVLWEIAQAYADAHDHARRFHLPPGQIAFQHVAAQARQAVEAARAQWETAIEAGNQHPGGGHLDFMYGHAQLLSPTQIVVHTPSGPADFQADHCILATGSVPRKLPHIPIDEQTILTSDGIANLQDYPKSIVILGAGVIGCEFATIFALLGRTQVFLIDKADRILPFEDEDVAHLVQANLTAQGVHIHKGASLDKMHIVDGHVEYTLDYGDHKQVYQVEKALIAVGRTPNTASLGLDKLGIQVSDRGYILDCDKDTCTTVPNICAVGDLTADIALVNVAELEGRYAVEKLFGIATRPLCYDNVSTIMFLHPEVAAIGMNESEARQKGIPYRAASIDYGAIPRAIAMQRTQGFIKILVDPQTNCLLGMRALGAHASSAIQAASLMIRNRIPYTDLLDLIHPHPSITEGVQECARALAHQAIRPGPWLKVWQWQPATQNETIT